MDEKRKKKKILFIVEAMGGGVFTYIVDLSNELVKRYDMYIAYAIRPQTPSNYKDFFNDDIHLIQVDSFTRELNWKKDLASIGEIRKIVREIQPDVIHLHSSKAGAIGRIALNNCGVPLFYTPHGYSFLMKNYKPMKRFLFRTIEWICARTKCTTISCSKGENEETLKLTKNATYVNNGINTQEIDDVLSSLNNQNINDNTRTVFTLGRICYQKNPRLFNEIAKKMPQLNFIWIGDGELRDDLTSSNITITGWKSREEALAISSKASIFILTSLWEGLPISLLEAMYMKKLCIVSNTIGNRDVIKNNINGYVCDTPDQFVKAINSDNETLREQAYFDIINGYNTQVMAQKYSEIYEKKILEYRSYNA